MMNNYFVIGIPREISGIGHILKSTTSWIIYAKQQGYIPVVDLQHYTNQYFKKNKVFQDNTWEYFFKQPNDVSLNDIPLNANIKLNNKISNFPNKELLEIDSFVHINHYIDNKNTDKLLRLNTLKVLFKNNIRFNDVMLLYFQKMLKKYHLSKGTKILGVLCRGTDYLLKKPLGELKQPKPEYLIKQIKKVHSKYDKIFLATEDLRIWNKFKSVFGDKLLPNYQYMFGNNYSINNFLCDTKVERKNHTFNLAKEYLFSLFMLSKCDGFIGGYTNGTVIAWILSEHWNFIKIYDKGFYKKPSKIFSIKKQYNNEKELHILVQILGIRIRLRRLTNEK